MRRKTRTYLAYLGHGQDHLTVRFPPDSQKPLSTAALTFPPALSVRCLQLPLKARNVPASHPKRNISNARTLRCSATLNTNTRSLSRREFPNQTTSRTVQEYEIRVFLFVKSELMKCRNMCMPTDTRHVLPTIRFWLIAQDCDE